MLYCRSISLIIERRRELPVTPVEKLGEPEKKMLLEDEVGRAVGRDHPRLARPGWAAITTRKRLHASRHVGLPSGLQFAMHRNVTVALETTLTHYCTVVSTVNTVPAL